MPERDCLACDIIAGKVIPPGGTIYQDDCWMVDHSVSPVLLPGFLIVKPIRHCEHIAHLSEKEAARLGSILQRTAQAVMRATGAEKVYVVSLGELVKHIHFCIIPRYPGVPENGFAVLEGMNSGKWACSDQEAAEIVSRIRENYWRSKQ